MRSTHALIGGLGFCLILLGAGVPAFAGPEETPTAQVAEDGRGVYTVKGSFTVAAPPSLAWSVLSGYDQLGERIPSMRSSVIKRSGPTSALVAQESTVYVLAFPKRLKVLLQVDEEPERRIDFEDTAREDFEVYYGSWQLEKIPGGTRVDYVANARPRMNVPFFGKSFFLDTVKGLLGDLRREMLRRATAKGAWDSAA
ncbi:SRPBCC family protein [bacterium]|nr:SRPBCC family protein [bacterium]